MSKKAMCRRVIKAGSCAALMVALFVWPAFARANASDDAASLVRISRMLAGEAPADPADADRDGDGIVTPADLELMLRRVHGRELPERLDQREIGSSGGMVGASECSLVVPSGAFNTTETLTVDRLPAGDAPLPIDDQGLLYEISGIPGQAQADLVVRLALPDGMAPDGLLLELGERTFSTSGSDWRYRCVVPVLDGDHLTWSVPPIPAASAPLAGDEDDADRAVLTAGAAYTPTDAARTNYTFRFRTVRYSRLTGARFDLFFAARHAFHRDRLWNVVNALEDAYAMASDPLGFGFSFAGRTTWPVAVYLLDLGTKDGDYVSSNWGVDSDWIELNANLLPRLNDMRITAGHEFFHLIQAIYGSKPGNLWLDEATATWFEKRMTQIADPYVPRTYGGDPRMALRGMHVEPYVKKQLAWNPQNWFTWKTESAQYRGYGLAAFIEYLSLQPWWTPGFLRTVYTEVGNGTHPVAALTAAVGSPANFKSLWEEFCRTYYLVNDVYPLPPNAVSRLMIDNQSAYGIGSEGQYGISLKPKFIASMTNFAMIQEFEMKVQQLGGRSIRYQFADSDFLPDPVTLASEVECVTLEDMRNLSLATVMMRPGANDNEWVLERLPGSEADIDPRMTHRLDLEFPRPTGKFALMLALINKNVDEPYDDRAPVTWRTFATSFPFNDFSVNANLFPQNDHAPVAVCRVNEALIEGDLGKVEVLDDPMGSVMPGAQGLSIDLPHDQVASLRLRIDGSLEPPLTRTVPVPGGQWVVVIAEDLGWQVQTVTGAEPVLGSVIEPDIARTTGIELAAPDPTGEVIYGVARNFKAHVHWQDADALEPEASYYVADWYVMPFVVTIRGVSYEPPEESP